MQTLACRRDTCRTHAWWATGTEWCIYTARRHSYNSYLRTISSHWCFAAQRCYVHKTNFWENHNDTKVIFLLSGHTTFVLLTPARTVTIIDKVTIFCNNINKTIISIELVAINILCYMSQRSIAGLGIKSMARLKTFMEEWNGHNTFAHPPDFLAASEYPDPPNFCAVENLPEKLRPP